MLSYLESNKNGEEIYYSYLIIIMACHDFTEISRICYSHQFLLKHFKF